MNWVAFLISIVALLNTHNFAFSQTATSPDEKARLLLKEKPGSAILITEASLIRNKAPMTCPQTIMTIRSKDGKNSTFQTQTNFLGNTARAAPAVVPAGEYVVASIRCHGAKINYNGPFARLLLRPGEAVNAGNLIIDYESEGLFGQTATARIKVEKLNAAAIAFLKEKAPQTLMRAINRPMQPLRSVVQFRGLGL